MQNLEKIKSFIIRNIKWIVLSICLVIFLAILESVFSKEIMKIDTIGYQTISNILISDFVTPIAKFITNMGSAIILIAITIMILIFVKNKKIGVSVGINLVIASSLNALLKNIIQRPRPIGFRLIDETGYSFPSRTFYG